MSYSRLINDSIKNDFQARFWVQVIGDLRKGVTLKKVEENLTQKRSNDEEKKSKLTPYESLMDDIRQRRYHLKKAPEPSANRRKDTHAVILDYIRSRPSLKKVIIKWLMSHFLPTFFRQISLSYFHIFNKFIQFSGLWSKVGASEERVHSARTSDGEHKAGAKTETCST